MKKTINAPTEKIEKQIELYHKYLESYERVEYDELAQDLIKLRSHILFVHSTIESLLHFLICGHIAKSFGWKSSTPTAAISLFKIQPFLEEIDYARLITTCKEEKIISKDIYSKLMKVNTHRVRFAHPNAKQKEIAKYKDNDAYLQVMKDLSNGLSAITEASKHWSQYLEKENLFREKFEKQSQLAPENNEVGR